MGLSNYLPSSRLIQPGVCTSTTRPASPFNGQVIYETDTKQTLVWQGSSWVMLTDADTPPGLELVKTQTIGSGVSSVTINDAFPSGYDCFEVLSSGTTATNTDNIAVQLTTGGTAAATSYYGSMPYALWTGGSILLHSVDNQNSWLAASATDSSFGMALNMRFINPNQARATYFTSIHIRNIGGNFTGAHSTATSYDGFKLTISTGTISGGTIRVYGYRNSI